MIFLDKPSDWKDLEQKVVQIFREAGCAASRNKTLDTVRGDVDIDVIVWDRTRRPHTLILCECKHWNRRVPKTVVHAFRTVVHDSGANLGFIISDSGFQAGSYEAARKANIRLVTWVEFQSEIYERWFAVMERRLVNLADRIAEISDACLEPNKHKTLVSEAIDIGGESAWNEFDRLKAEYVEFTFASTVMLGRAPRRFPYRGLNSKKVFKSARMFFDTMFELAPRAFTEFPEFLLRYTAGRCGVHQVFDDSVLAELVEGKTTMKTARDLFGWTGVMQRVPSGEIWTFRGSITHFDFPAGTRRKQIGMCRTLERKLAIDFGPSEIARRITIGDVEYFRPPRL